MGDCLACAADGNLDGRRLAAAVVPRVESDAQSVARAVLGRAEGVVRDVPAKVETHAVSRIGRGVAPHQHPEIGLELADGLPLAEVVNNPRAVLACLGHGQLQDAVLPVVVDPLYHSSAVNLGAGRDVVVEVGLEGPLRADDRRGEQEGQGQALEKMIGWFHLFFGSW